MADTTRLPGPVMELWEWQYKGLCRQADPEIFFHPEGERGGTRRRRDEAAKAICAKCPVLDLCREHALRVQEPYGVWGGLTEDERAEMIAVLRAHERSGPDATPGPAAHPPSAHPPSAHAPSAHPPNAEGTAARPAS